MEDCRCALRWIKQNAEELGLDPERIVTSGSSAGGHLSLTTGMLPAEAGFDRLCPTRDLDGIGRVATHDEEMSVAAIVNWFGITDVGDLLAGKNAKTYAVHWMGSKSDRFELAEDHLIATDDHPLDLIARALSLHGFLLAAQRFHRVRQTLNRGFELVDAGAAGCNVGDHRALADLQFRQLRFGALQRFVQGGDLGTRSGDLGTRSGDLGTQSGDLVLLFLQLRAPRGDRQRSR